jgi:hypothetical protein
VHERVDAKLANRRVDRPRPVGRRVDEGERGGDRIAPAGDEALALERREAREHGEADPQPRVRGTPDEAEGVPRGVHARDVARHRGPPGRRARGALGVQRARRRAGVDEQGRAASLEQREHRLERHDGGRLAERVGGDARADEAAIEQAGKRFGVRLRQPDRRPCAEPRRQLGDARMVGVEERRRLVRGEGLDAQRRRRRDERSVDVVRVQQGGATVGVVVARIHRPLALAVDAQRPAVAAPDDHRRSPAARERGEQCFGPEVLVDVDRGHSGED